MIMVFSIDNGFLSLVTDKFYSLTLINSNSRLESLFYLDTPSKQGQSGLVKPKPKVDMGRRIDKNALSLYSKDKDASNDDNTTEKGISAKTFSVQNRRECPENKSNREKNSLSVNPPKEVYHSAKEDEDTKSISNGKETEVNTDKVSLAQSFFNTDKTKKPPPQRRISATSSLNTQNDTPSPCSSLSGWSSESTQGKSDRRSYPLPPERASFQPNNSVEVEEEEDDFLTDFYRSSKLKKGIPNINKIQSANNRQVMNKGAEKVHLKTPSQIHKERSPSSLEDAPPIPERSAQPKMMMLKLMKNATNALK